MKYVSFVIFAIALAWTWNLVHSESDISFETHSGIQEKLGNLILETIKTKKPNASDIHIEKIWTEVMSADKVRAFFIYSFKDNSESGLITTQIHGEGLLERQGQTEDGSDHWVLSKVQANSDAIQFDEATIITGSSNSTEDASGETPASTEANPASSPATSEEHH